MKVYTSEVSLLDFLCRSESVEPVLPVLFSIFSSLSGFPLPFDIDLTQLEKKIKRKNNKGTKDN